MVISVQMVCVLDRGEYRPFESIEIAAVEKERTDNARNAKECEFEENLILKAFDKAQKNDGG